MRKSKAAYRSGLRVMALRVRPDPPSPAALLEAKRAAEQARKNPLGYVFGDPLPGRSALDKQRRKENLK